MIEIDKLLEKCGDFHRYQMILLGIFCIINLLSSMHYYSQTIISFIPEHWCYDESLQNLTIREIEEIFKNVESDARCTKVRLNRLNDDEIFISPEVDAEIELPTLGRIEVDKNSSCSKWVYDLDYGYESMTVELNWVCGQAWKATLGQSMFFVGSVVGTLVFGIIADKVGRVLVLIASNLMAFIGNILTIFTTTVTTFCICRFISGLATDSNFVMMYIIVMEYIRPSARTTGLSICIGVFYCLGSIFTPWLAVVFGNWKMFLLTSAIPLLIVPFFYFLVPESAQWLITQKRYGDAVECFKRIARVNGKHVEDVIYQDVIMKCSTHMATSNVNTTVFDLFKTPRLRKNTLILFFKSMVITLCYDAISRNVEGLGISPFVMFSLSATAILPACIVLILLQDKIGRKAMASSSLLISGIFTSATGVIIATQKSARAPYILVSLAIIGRFGVTVAYNSGAQYAAELIPTCVRGQGVATVHVFGYAITFFSSYILFLAHFFKSFPELVLGSLSLIGAALCLLLPETLNRTLPCTIEEAESFGKGERIFDFSCFERRKTDSIEALEGTHSN